MIRLKHLSKYHKLPNNIKNWRCTKAIQLLGKLLNFQVTELIFCLNELSRKYNFLLSWSWYKAQPKDGSIKWSITFSLLVLKKSFSKLFQWFFSGNVTSFLYIFMTSSKFLAALSCYWWKGMVSLRRLCGNRLFYHDVACSRAGLAYHFFSYIFGKKKYMY